MASLLIVESKDGAQVAVEAAYFRRKLEPDGWKAIRFEDGSDYEPPPQRATTPAKSDEKASE